MCGYIFLQPTWQLTENLLVYWWNWFHSREKVIMKMYIGIWSVPSAIAISNILAYYFGGRYIEIYPTILSAISISLTYMSVNFFGLFWARIFWGLILLELRSWKTLIIISPAQPKKDIYGFYDHDYECQQKFKINEIHDDCNCRCHS